MSDSQSWPSPAKLNLFLHITGRRDDGYHELQTLFQLIDFGDELGFAVSDDGEIRLRCDNPALAGEDNLVHQAAQALKRKTGSDAGVTITLSKRLPMGAGLGGGSSNAATTLVALNLLWQLGCTGEELEEIGLSLGADVPVFVRGCSGWAEGVGEKLQPIDLPQRWFVVLNPAIHVSTAELFNDRELTRDCSPITIRAFQDGVSTQNVFEPVVRNRFAEVDFALNALSRALGSAAGAEAEGLSPSDLAQPRMTGTGSSVFIACESEAMARKVLIGVYNQYKPVGAEVHSNDAHTSQEPPDRHFTLEVADRVVTAFVARGVACSPLLVKAARNTGHR